MARLIVVTQGLGLGALELRMGVNRVGRDPKCDFPITHASISVRHCEFILSADGVFIHDCGSTNGTFVNGQRVTEAWLEDGQRVQLGQIELQVETIGVQIGIPKIEREPPKPPPAIKPDTGELMCPRHTDHPVMFRCLTCLEVMCTSCVRMIRKQGGRPLFLCCLCHQHVERISEVKQKPKKGLFGFLQDTVRLKFKNPREGEN